ncbi:fluoride efflux transporter FluC [Aeromicrobium tamlense]|uniref:Fluoride-specific ion channel FluC n=1 Tax=Aeromicrobium tamlense TaxID=375541 RepID=A0ABX2SDH3_9ACTN|nr:CrcB family protein [Aeromicrobium tamlense]NYI36959.1 CrcB protein [Aeromicrobium tamlense]
MRADDASSQARPLYASPGALVLVLIGGAIGTAVRASLAEALPPAAGDWPWATFAVNVVGSFLLGALVAVVSGREVGRLRYVRPALGAGVLGGFTTYSTFAVEVERLLTGGAVGLGLAYGVLSVLLGVLAAAAGVLVGGGVRPPAAERDR